MEDQRQDERLTREVRLVRREPVRTLRDEFAMAALAGMLADPAVQVGRSTQNDPLAKAAYQIADAMLKAREAGE